MIAPPRDSPSAISAMTWHSIPAKLSPYAAPLRRPRLPSLSHTSTSSPLATTSILQLQRTMAGVFPTTHLFNKVALITGASGGIGAATAVLFARAGAHVIVSARRKEALEEVCRRAEKANKEGGTGAGGRCVSVVLDVSDRRATDSEYQGGRLGRAERAMVWA